MPQVANSFKTDSKHKFQSENLDVTRMKGHKVISEAAFGIKNNLSGQDVLSADDKRDQKLGLNTGSGDSYNQDSSNLAIFGQNNTNVRSVEANNPHKNSANQLVGPTFLQTHPYSAIGLDKNQMSSSITPKQSHF